MACPTTVTPGCDAKIVQIEESVRRALGHPGGHGTSRLDSGPSRPSPGVLFSAELISNLKASVNCLSAAACALGERPRGYPLWADLAIRSVAALLPWYTRSLKAYARAVGDTAAATAALIEDAERRARESAR
ncbi:MAG: hypothetical protein C0504_02145 [Candidatus Solibacter sp.]|nr:hypothetical protein [Candidatus Solibacter sp.]